MREVFYLLPRKSYEPQTNNPRYPNRLPSPTASHARHTFFWIGQASLPSTSRSPLRVPYLPMSYLIAILDASPTLMTDVMCACPRTALGRKLRARLTIADLTA